MRPSRADPVDQLAQRHLLGRVHAGGRLVESDQLRIGRQGARHLEPALIAVAQGAGLVFGEAGDADVVEQLPRPRRDRRLLGLEARCAEHGADQSGMGAHVAADHHVLERRHVGEQADVLEGAGNARLGDLVHRARLVRLAAELEAAGVGRVEAGQHVEEGGLAGSVGADQAVDLAALDRDADVRQRLQAAEALGHAGHPQDEVRRSRRQRRGLRHAGFRSYAIRW